MNLCLTLAFLPLIISPFLAQTSPDVTVAFSSNEQLYITDFKGAPTQLTDTLADTPLLVWSPDGTQLAFLSKRPDQQYNQYRLDVMNLATKEIKPLSSLNLTIEANLAWSPDGHSIAVTLGALYVVDVQTGDVKQLSKDTVSAQNPSWSPDSSRIAFAANNEIDAIDPDGQQLQNISGSDDTLNNIYPEWSPVSNQVAFVFFNDTVGPTIVIADTDTLSITPLQELHGDSPVYPHWSPNGKQIAFDLQASQGATIPTVDGSDVFVMNADGSALHSVTEKGYDRFIGWVSDSEILYYRGDPASASGSFFVVDPAYNLAVRLSDATLDNMCSYSNCGSVAIRP